MNSTRNGHHGASPLRWLSIAAFLLYSSTARAGWPFPETTGHSPSPQAPLSPPDGPTWENGNDPAPPPAPTVPYVAPLSTPDGPTWDTSVPTPVVGNYGSNSVVLGPDGNPTALIYDNRSVPFVSSRGTMLVFGQPGQTQFAIDTRDNQLYRSFTPSDPDFIRPGSSATGGIRLDGSTWQVGGGGSLAVPQAVTDGYLQAPLPSEAEVRAPYHASGYYRPPPGGVERIGDAASPQGYLATTSNNTTYYFPPGQGMNARLMATGHLRYDMDTLQSTGARLYVPGTDGAAPRLFSPHSQPPTEPGVTYFAGPNRMLAGVTSEGVRAVAVDTSPVSSYVPPPDVSFPRWSEAASPGPGATRSESRVSPAGKGAPVQYNPQPAPDPAPAPSGGLGGWGMRGYAAAPAPLPAPGASVQYTGVTASAYRSFLDGWTRDPAAAQPASGGSEVFYRNTSGERIGVVWNPRTGTFLVHRYPDSPAL